MNKNVKTYLKSDISLFIISMAISYLCYAIGATKAPLDSVTENKSKTKMSLSRGQIRS